MVQWWNRKYGKGKICAITNCRLRPGKNKLGFSYCVFLSCKHGFYRSALVKWFLTNPENPSCPMCRKIFNPEVVF